MHMCPECGFEIEDPAQEICKCGFDFGTTLDCPYKISGNCVSLKTKCNINGLDFEDCKIYLKDAGIMNG